ncbi:MAG TPA: hypothetical protein VGG08_04210 [Solirubrobacteraceae bacterium]|jgi:hypothetical protein
MALTGSFVAVASAGSSTPARRVFHAANWSTHGGQVVCGLADVHGTAVDPGTGAPERGLWPGLQCSARGIPRAPGPVGDPFVQLGQGRAGRAKLVDLSQDDLLVSGDPKPLPSGSRWVKDGIACAVHARSIACHNSAGHGFTMSPGHVHLH